MLGRITFLFITAVFFVTTATLASAENQVLAEVRFEFHNRAEKTAGVWVDGQYMGYAKELKGNKKLLLVPGKHEIVVRQPWYKDYSEEAVLEPGEVHTVNISLTKNAIIPAKDATGELKISAVPDRAAVFVDEQFTGHVNEFNGVGKALLLTPGRHQVRIALPGYLPFETVVDLRPHQKLKIETALQKGSITDAGSLVSQNDAR
ncbi:MAG TPA: PEGA domain-containing protein [Terriglobales bacterium]|nr:PEGA domain-containing protein [Terriglobales bacterium]